MEPSLRAEIIRLREIERFPIGTITRHLGIHHSTVMRALAAADACLTNLGGRILLRVQPIGSSATRPRRRERITCPSPVSSSSPR